MSLFWTKEKLSELARLANEERLSVHEISLRFGKSGHAISQILYAHGLLTAEELHRRHGERTRSKREKLNAEILGCLDRSKSSPDMGYVLGALMGDGSITTPSDGGVSNIDVKDLAFATEFLRALSEVTGGRAKIRSRYCKRTSFIGTHKIVSEGVYHWVGNCNKVASRFFLSHTNKEFVLAQSAEFVSSFLRGAFDSDGSVPRREANNPKRWAIEITVLANHENDLIEACLKRLGIGFKHYISKLREGHLRPMHRIVIRAHTDVLRYEEIVGFTVSHRKDRLDQMVRSIRGGALR
jgi:LAGLIDADG-like domain/WhiA LAGLIDADG-like domain